jgi:uncharacterized protein (DUF2344 family)
MQKQIYTLVVDFSIGGDLAYLSHQETLKMFQRALVRASVPLVFSMGFNPHPRLSIPFPRSVGTQSVRDRICATVEFPEDLSVQDWQVRIQQQLPADCAIGEVQSIPGKCMFHPQSALYLEALDFTNDQIEVACGISQSGTVRVDELMQWLHIAQEQFAEPVCRTEIKWRQN